MKLALIQLLTGAAMGALISAALFGPALVSVERAMPNGLNVFVGEYGYHFAMGAVQ